MRKLFAFILTVIIGFSVFAPKAIAQELPFSLMVEPGNGMVKLTWEQVPGAVQGYKIFRRVGEGSKYDLPLTEYAIFGNTYFDTSAENGEIHCYYVIALDQEQGTLAQSNEVCASPSDKLPSFVEPCKKVLVYTLGSYVYTANGVAKNMSAPFVQMGNRTYLAFRYVTEEIGGTIEWGTAERKITVKYKSVSVEMWVGKSTAMINGVPSQIDPNDPKVAPFIQEGRTFVPLRFPVEALKEGEVKWFAVSKQAQLSFPGFCEETKEGVLTMFSNESSLGTLTGWDGEVYLVAILPTVSYKPILGDCIRVTGRNDNTNYPGFLAVSKVEPMACPEQGQGTWKGKVAWVDCSKNVINIEAQINGKTAIARVVLPATRLFASVCANLSVGDCVQVAGKIIFDPHFDNIASGMWDYKIDANNLDEIPCEGQEAPKPCPSGWLSGEIADVNCLDGFVKVSVKGETIQVALPDTTNCLELEKGMCARFCAQKAGSTYKAQYFYGFKCDGGICQGKLIVGKLLNVNCQMATIKIAQGDKYVVISIEGMDCERILAMHSPCVRVCVVEIGEGQSVALAVTPASSTDCQQECKGKIVQAKVLRVDCDKMLAYLQLLPLKSEVIGATISFTNPAFCGLEIGSCYEFCVELKGNSELAAQWFRKIECQITCDGELLVGKIESIDCEKKSAVLTQKDGNKTAFLLSGADCKKLSNGFCVRVCLGKNAAGGYEASYVEVLPPKECEPEQLKQCDGTEGIVSIVKIDCESKILTVKIIDAPMGVGMTFDVPADDSMCESLKDGMCLKVCVKLEGMFDIALLWWEELPPDKCGNVTPPAPCKEVKGNAASVGGGILLLEGGGTFKAKSEGQLEGIKEGDCVLLCHVDGVITWIKKLDKTECGDVPCDKTIIVKVGGVVCEKRVLEGIELSPENAGSDVRIVFSEQGANDFCKMVAGQCYLVCLVKNPDGMYFGVSAKPADCPAAPTCEGEETNAKVLKTMCDNGEVVFEVWGLAKEIAVPKDFCIRFREGYCVRMCVTSDDFGNLKASQFRMLGPSGCQECKGKTVQASVVLIDCNNSTVTALLKNGQRATYTATLGLCASLKVGVCYDFCIEMAGTGAEKIVKAAEISRGPCQPEVDFEKQGKIVRANCQVNTIYIQIDETIFEVLLPEGANCAEYKIGLCVRVVGWRDKSSDTRITAKAVRFIECPVAIRSFYGVVQATNCREGTALVKVDNVNYTVILPTGFNCEGLSKGDCVEFKGSFDEGQKSTINTTAMEEVKCPEPEKVWQMYVFETECRSQTPNLYARFETTFYPVFVPKGFDCGSIQSGDCIIVTGVMKRATTGNEIVTAIEASSIKKTTCEAAGRYMVKVIGLHCDKLFLWVEYFGKEYSLYYPRGFACTSIAIGDCLLVSGTIWTVGYIDGYTVTIAECPQKEETWDLFVTYVNCRERFYYCRSGNSYYQVVLPKDLKCETFNPGDCIKATGVLQQSGRIRAYIINASAIARGVCPRATGFIVKITSINCQLPWQSLVVEHNEASYNLYFPSSISCTQFVVGDCYYVTGFMDPTNKYIYAYSMQKTECPSVGWHIVIGDVRCSANGNIIYCYIGKTRYTLSLPRGFKCEELKKGDCYFVTGRIDTAKMVIYGTSLKKERCS